MSDVFYFDAPWSLRAAGYKKYRLPARRHRSTGKRRSALPKMDLSMERACMARCDEPLFCDNVPFQFFTRPEHFNATSMAQDEMFSDDDDESGGVFLDVPQDELFADGLDERSNLHGNAHDESHPQPAAFTATKATDVAETYLDLTQSVASVVSRSPAHITQVGVSAAILGTRSRPGNEEISQEEDSRRQRLALLDESADGIPRPHATPEETSGSRRLSQQRSCESLRSVLRHGHGSRPPISRTNSAGTLPTNNAASGQLMPPVTEGRHEDPTPHENIISPPLINPAISPDLYGAVGADMVTWDVNDYRHTYDFADFVDEWEFGDQRSRMITNLPVGLREALLSGNSQSPAVPVKERENVQIAETGKDVTRKDLDSGLHDMQAILWSDTQTTREVAMQQRTYLHPFNEHRTRSTTNSYMVSSSDALQERYFRFHRFNARHRPTFTHYQLRNVVSYQDRDIFYCSNSKVLQAPLVLPSETIVAMNLTNPTVSAEPMKITCIATSPPRTYQEYTTDSVLVAGGFYGEYALRNLHSHEPHTEGYVTYDFNGLVTHIHTFDDRRSGALQAAFCSNDSRLRIMDVRTLKYTNTFSYAHSLNCAVTAPDGRLRAIVGDSTDALITDAQSGGPITTLKGHTDHIFATAWSPTERFVATAAQDGKVLLWDSRNWSTPLATLPSAMTCARSLHFTPNGAALIAAENEDVVRIWDMADPKSEQKQDLRFFGTIAGVALSKEGNELVVANGDRTVGGLLCYRRAAGAGTFNSSPAEAKAGERAAMRERRAVAARRGAMVADLVV